MDWSLLWTFLWPDNFFWLDKFFYCQIFLWPDILPQQSDIWCLMSDISQVSPTNRLVTLKRVKTDLSYFGVATVSNCFNNCYILIFCWTIFRYFLTVKKTQRFVTRQWTFQTSLIGHPPPLKGFLFFSSELF